MIAKAILSRKASALIRPMFPAFQANVVAYVVALVSLKLGDQLDLMRIWLQQDLSSALKMQIQVWAREVNDVLHSTSSGRMISEWAKHPECWTAVSGARFSTLKSGIPELRVRSALASS